MKKNPKSAAGSPKAKTGKLKSLRVLMVEDSQDDALLIIRELKKGGDDIEYERVETASAMKKALKEKQWDVVLCDYKLPKFGGLQAIALLKKANIDIPLVIVSGTIGEQTAVECMKAGARDYIMKDNLSRLCPAIARELEEGQIRINQKLAERQIEESEEKYRLLFENAGEAIFIAQDGLLKLANAKTEEIIGYTRKELASRHFIDFIHEEDRALVLERHTKRQRGVESPSRYSFRIMHRSGHTVWVELNAVRIEWEGKAATLNFLNDITERKEAEEALEERNRELDNLMHNLPGMVYRCANDREWTMFFISEGCLALTGYMPEDLLNNKKRSFNDLVMPEYRENLWQKWQEVLAARAAFEDEYPIRTAGGAIKWVWERGRGVYDPDGQLLFLEGYIEDISARKKAKEELRSSEEKYRTILETMEEGYYEVDLAGNLTFFNDSMCRIWGYPKAELVGMNNRQYTDAENAKNLFQSFNRVFKTGNPANEFDWQIIRKDETIRNIEASISLRKDSSGKPVGFRGIVRDVTDRKKAEEALQKSEEKYRLIFEHSPLGLLYFDEKGVILDCNENLVKIIGSSREALSGLNMLNLPNKGVISAVRQALSGRTGFYEDMYHSVTAKKITPVRALFTPLAVNGRLAQGGIGIIEDITDRKNAELQREAAREELLKSEENFRRSLDESPLGIRITTAAAETIYANKAALDIYGCGNIEELNKIPVKERYTPESYAAYKLRKEKREHGKNGPTEYEISIVQKKGGIRHVQAFRKNILWNNSKQYQVLYRDITEQKRAEVQREAALEELRKSEQKYRSIIENAQEGIYQVNPEGRHLTLNSAFARMLGYDSPEEVMQTLTDVSNQLYVRPQDRKKIFDLVNKRGAVTNFETEFYKKDGSRIWVSVNINTVRDNQGRLLYYQGIYQDITEKKKMERERQENFMRLRKSLGATIRAMAVTVETRDPYTAGHQRRVADLARAIAGEMHLPGDQIEGLHMAGMIHDIGKISIPSEILTKPTELTNLEYNLIKTHPDAGYNILKDIEFPWPIARMVLEHHERIDGSGYPYALKGDKILLEAKILAVADVVEAISSHRPYRAAHGIEAALEEISKSKGILYDAGVVDICLRLFREKHYTLPA